MPRALGSRSTWRGPRRSSSRSPRERRSGAPPHPPGSQVGGRAVRPRLPGCSTSYERMFADGPDGSPLPPEEEGTFNGEAEATITRADYALIVNRPLITALGWRLPPRLLD